MVKNTKRLKRRSGKRSRRNTRNIRRPRRSKRNIRRTRRRRSKKVYLSRGGGSCQLAKRPPYPKVGDVIIFEGDEEKDILVIKIGEPVEGESSNDVWTLLPVRFILNKKNYDKKKDLRDIEGVVLPSDFVENWEALVDIHETFELNMTLFEKVKHGVWKKK